MSHELYRLVRKLEQYGTRFRLDRHRDDSVMITVMLVGERIEIDVFEDGTSSIPDSEAMRAWRAMSMP